MTVPHVSPPQIYPQYDRDPSLGGIVAPMTLAGSTGALTAGRAYLGRFVPSRNMTIASIAFVVTVAAGADDACDVGIYAADGSKIVSSGATTGKLNAGTGVKSIAVAASLIAGTPYFAAFSVVTPFGGTAASVALAGVPTATSAGLFNAVAGTPDNRSLQMVKDSSHPLPSSFTFSTMNNPANTVMLAVREF